MFPQTCPSFCLPLSVLSNSILVTLARDLRVILTPFSLILHIQSVRRACWAQPSKSVWPLSTSHQFPPCARPCVAGLPDFYPCLLPFCSQWSSQSSPCKIYTRSHHSSTQNHPGSCLSHPKSKLTSLWWLLRPYMTPALPLPSLTPSPSHQQLSHTLCFSHTGLLAYPQTL